MLARRCGSTEVRYPVFQVEGILMTPVTTAEAPIQVLAHSGLKQVVI